MLSMIFDVDSLNLMDIDLIQSQLRYDIKLIENLKIQEASLKLNVGDPIRIDWNGVIMNDFSYIIKRNSTLYKYGVVTKISKFLNFRIFFIALFFIALIL